MSTAAERQASIAASMARRGAVLREVRAASGVPAGTAAPIADATADQIKAAKATAVAKAPELFRPVVQATVAPLKITPLMWLAIGAGAMLIFQKLRERKGKNE